MLKFSDIRGFTLIELLVFAAIFSMAAIVFIGILVVVAQIQVRQTSLAEVNQESQFVLQTIQRYIEESMAVDMPIDEPTSTLTLLMEKDADNPTLIYLDDADKIIYLKKGNKSPEALISTRMEAQDLTFRRRVNPGGKDTVDVVFTLAFRTENPQEFVSRLLQTGIARVSAVSFDTDVLPQQSGQNLGLFNQKWSSINQLIHFGPSSDNVGIGGTGFGATMSSRSEVRLDVEGGIRISTQNFSRPACTSSTPQIDELRGTIWIEYKGANATDTVAVCVKTYDDGTNVEYGWVPLIP